VACDDPAALIEVEAIFGRIMAFENDLITNHIIKFGAHTRPELAFLLSVVHRGDFIFDLGGHIGTFAIPLAHKVSDPGKLLVVEGRLENFSVLEKNIANARLPAETKTLNALIVPSERRYEAHTPAGNTGATFFLPVDTAGVATETVTIQELCHRYFTPRIVKVDIEGCEVFALASSKLLQRERPIIYAEVNGRLLSQQGSSISELDGLFRDNGYRLFRNFGDRNAAHDKFVTLELGELAKGGQFFDVLAIHRADERLEPVINSMSDR
jgi:FkbM family methyltransferase